MTCKTCKSIMHVISGQIILFVVTCVRLSNMCLCLSTPQIVSIFLKFFFLDCTNFQHTAARRSKRFFNRIVRFFTSIFIQVLHSDCSSGSVKYLCLYRPLPFVLGFIFPSYPRATLTGTLSLNTQNVIHRMKRIMAKILRTWS